jgi:flagellar basal-body rod protein FlgG
MIRALYTSSSGMQAQQTNLDAIANNLANVNTVGFKRTRVDFQDLLYRTFRAPGTVSANGIMVPTGIQVGHGTRLVATQRIFGQGDFQQTENPLDLVIEDDGFFQILRPDGTTAYTRSGALKKDGTGRIVTSDGFLLQPAITIPGNATSVAVGSDGAVSVTLPGQTTAQQVGGIQLARFVNPAGLQSIGRSLFVPTQASGDPVVASPGTDGMGTIAQGFLEMSNVKVVEEMVAMITSQRAYEANSKAIQTADEMLNVANNMRRCGWTGVD